jgi:hypothetical protein
MKKLFLLFSHTLTATQEADAKATFGVEQFVTLPTELQKLWSNVPATLEEVSGYLEPLTNYLKDNAEQGDLVLVQGDFGATYHMVNVVKSLGLTALHATTKRNAVEKMVDNKMVKTSVFEHVRFRAYA